MCNHCKETNGHARHSKLGSLIWVGIILAIAFLKTEAMNEGEGELSNSTVGSIPAATSDISAVEIRKGEMLPEPNPAKGLAFAAWAVVVAVFLAGVTFLSRKVKGVGETGDGDGSDDSDTEGEELSYFIPEELLALGGGGGVSDCPEGMAVPSASCFASIPRADGNDGADSVTGPEEDDPWASHHPEDEGVSIYPPDWDIQQDGDPPDPDRRRGFFS